MARRPKSQDLPGVERQQFKDLDAAISEYTDARDTWQEQGKTVTEAKKKLAELMAAYGMTKYRSGDLIAELKHKKDDVKVKPVKPDEIED